jgi:hypothetical protein
MYGKLAMTCFKYQVYLYGSEVITYLHAGPLGGNSASTVSHQTANPPTTGRPLPSLYGSITFTHLEANSCMVNPNCLWGVHMGISLKER